MAKIADILARMRANPADIRFEDAYKIADYYFGEPRQRRTSHRVWKTPWPGDPRVNLQVGKNGKAKDYQIQQLLRAIERKEGSDDES